MKAYAQIRNIYSKNPPKFKFICIDLNSQLTLLKLVASVRIHELFQDRGNIPFRNYQEIKLTYHNITSNLWKQKGKIADFTST